MGEAQHAHVPCQTHGTDHRLDGKFRMRLAHQDHLGVGRQAHQAAKGAQRFENPLVGFQESEDADERRDLVEAQLVPPGMAVGFGDPRAVRDHAHRTREPGRAHLALDEAAVYDRAARRFQQPRDHRQAFVVRADLQLTHPLGELARRFAALVLTLANVGVPIAPPDGEVGDQVVQVRLVHHHHARMAQGGLIDEIVEGVITHVVQCNIETRRLEFSVRAGEDFQIDQRPEEFDQGFGIVGDPAASRRQRGKKGHAHFSEPAPRRTSPRSAGS